MKPVVAIGFVALGLTGFAAGAAWVTSSGNDQELRDRLVHSEALLEAQARKMTAMQTQIEELHETNRSLTRGAAASPAPASVSGAIETSPDFSTSTMPATGARMPATDPSTGAPFPPAHFEGWVRKVLADEKAAEEAKQKAAEEQRRIERVNRRVDRAVETLALSGLQKDQLRSTLLAEETGRAQIFEKYRNNGDLFAFGDSGDGLGMGDAMRENRRVRDESLKSILTPEQYEKWNAQDRRGPFGGQGGFGGFGGGSGTNRGPNNNNPSKSGGQ